MVAKLAPSLSILDGKGVPSAGVRWLIPISILLGDDMGRGLNEAGRSYIKSLVNRNEDGDCVVKEIGRLVKKSEWNYEKNVEFVRWLERKGWKVTAHYLWNHISS